MAEQVTSAGLEAPVAVPEFALRIHAAKRYRLCVKLPECLVGRAAEAHIRLPQLAPRHCCLYWANQTQLWVKALEGEVTLAGRTLQRALLRPGDLLDLGPVRLEILAVQVPDNALPGRSEAARRDERSAAVRSQAEEELARQWWRCFSGRLDRLEEWCRRLKADESDLADFCARLEELERRFAAPLPEHIVEKALAPLLRRLERLERRHARLLRRVLRWRRQQEYWQRHVEEELRHWDAQTRELSRQLQQAQQTLQQASDQHRHLAEQVAGLEQGGAEAIEQAAARAVDAPLEHVFRQIEHLERRFRELEQWTRCLRRELRHETHSEVESRLADLRAEREALETLRQGQTAPSAGIPATAPGVGFPVVKDKDKEPLTTAPEPTNRSDTEPAATEETPPESEPETPTGASTSDAPTAVPPTADQEKREELPPQTPLAAGAEETPGVGSPGEPQAEAESEPPHATEVPGPSDQASEELAPPATTEPHAVPALQSPGPEDSASEQPPAVEEVCPGSEAAPEQSAETGACELSSQLSTVALFRRLGIQVPGLEAEEREPVAPAPEEESAPSESSAEQPQAPEAFQQRSPSALESHDGETTCRSDAKDEEPQVPGAATFDGESVEDYMTRLLQSIEPQSQGATPLRPEESAEQAPAPGEEPRQSDSPATEVKRDIEITAEVLKAAPGSLPAALEETSQEHPARVIPAESPETLHSLRRLANKSARTAIENYQRRLKLGATQMKVVISVLAMLASFAMMWFAGSLPHKWVYAAALGSLGISVYYGLRYLMLTAQSTAAEEDLLEED